MFVELVCGLPGSGKTTYCEGKRQFVDQFYGTDRDVVIINLDPANDGVFPYPCDIDVGQLVQREVVMEEEGLGPNGSYLFCIELMAARVDWLIGEMEAAQTRVQGHSNGNGRPLWFIVDCPGQVEFYVHSEGLRHIVHTLTKRFRASIVMTHLCDAVVATRDVPTYVSTCLLCLSCMVDLELPHVNVLTKWDRIVDEDGDDEERSAFLETGNFLEDHFNRLWAASTAPAHASGNPYVQHAAAAAKRAATATSEAAGDENEPSPSNTARGPKRLRAMAKALMSVVDGYGLVGFERLDVQSEPLMRSVCDRVDMAAGHLR